MGMRRVRRATGCGAASPLVRGIAAMDAHGLPRSSRAAALLGHHACSVLCASIVAVVAVGLVPPPGVLAFTVPVLLFGFVILTFLMMRQHDRGLCEACVHSMPLNPAEQATRLHRRFWMAHTGSEPRFLLPYLVVVIGSNFATSVPGRVLWAAATLSMIYLLLSQSTHRKLQPWCPVCSGGGGGGEEVDTTPPVLPHDDRQLT
jgi:hypothetical protein